MNDVYVLYINHRYGHNLSVYATYELAWTGLAEYVRDAWPRWFEPDVEPPESEDQLIDMYFEKTRESSFNDEWYDIDPMPVIGASKE